MKKTTHKQACMDNEVTQTELIEKWLVYAASKTDREDIFLAGIGLIVDKNNTAYYAKHGLDCLMRAALLEVDGPEDHPAWPCGIKPNRS